jgi:hypothetical protein
MYINHRAMKKLQLEFRDEFRKAKDNFKVGRMIIVMTPPLDEDYWVFRIKLHEDQSLVAFPKFGTLGIGFAQEEDWNTNLPYQCTTIDIYNHIKCNKKYKEISRAECIQAIQILQKASKYYKENEMPKEDNVQDDLQGFGKYVERLEKFTRIRTKTL